MSNYMLQYCTIKTEDIQKVEISLHSNSNNPIIQRH